ncbi:MAG: DUF4912 domain-containing protein [Spirochaetales bacterium]|nr:DUF4912 domain-containing protein [Spirochaetales bacterium]
MRRERLQQLTIEDLQKIAEKENLDFSAEDSRDILIDLIWEAYTERVEEKREQDNYTVQVEETKYTITQDEDLEVSEGIDYPLPTKYNQTQVIFMTRDPFWAFTYWEIDDKTVESIKSDPGFEGLFLRVHDVKLINFNGSNSNFYFDIPILLSDKKWYINVPHANSVYLIELLYSSHGEKKIIAKSNVISTPREELSDVIDEAWSSANTDKIIDIIRKDFSNFHPASAGIPQRIISFVSSSYIPYGS